MRRAPTIAAALAAAVVSACGSSSGSNGANNASTPSTAVKTYLTALANGDGATACGALTPALQEQELKLVRSQGIKASSCPNLVSQLRAHITSAQRSLLLNATISRVTVQGSTAMVTVKGAAHATTLTKSGGKWLIAGGVTGG